VAQYTRILDSCQRLLNVLLVTRSIVLQAAKITSIRKEILEPTNESRERMVAKILMMFFIIFSSLKSRTPLPHYIPNPLHARKKVIKSFRNLPDLQEGHLKDVLFFFAYASGTKVVT
jgi:hypothetical protein